MTPAARIRTASDLLDQILAGQSAEQVLTRWARASRFAGSKDRAALRDLVFKALRCKRSYAALGGAETGRGLMIGALRAAGRDLSEVFNGTAYGPEPLSAAEHEAGRVPTAQEARDLPDWLWTEFAQSLGDAAETEARLLRARADVFLRINRRKSTLSQAQSALAADGITTQPHDLSATALRVTDGARRIHLSAAYRDGLVELQDAASQAVVDILEVQQGQSCLDYCAGGGGKSLALAAMGAEVTAHDIDVRRMKDVPLRAERAGVKIRTTTQPKGHYDLVLCDAPCSGSGSWRRAPEAKWRLSPERLLELTKIQDQVLENAHGFVAPGGHLAYATCSLLLAENSARVTAFIERNPRWHVVKDKQFLLRDGGDGFFVSVLKRD